MCQELNHLFICEIDSSIKQSDLMKLLQLCDAGKSMLTRVKKCLPDATKKIITVNINHSTYKT